MKLDEVLSLIEIRRYLFETMGNPSWDRKTVTYMNRMLLLVDQKILGILEGDEFKEYIDFKNVNDAIKKAQQASNIKSSLG